jgi:hypothetical protein
MAAGIRDIKVTIDAKRDILSPLQGGKVTTAWTMYMEVQVSREDRKPAVTAGGRVTHGALTEDEG